MTITHKLKTKRFFKGEETESGFMMGNINGALEVIYVNRKQLNITLTSNLFYLLDINKRQLFRDLYSS